MHLLVRREVAERQRRVDARRAAALPHKPDQSLDLGGGHTHRTE